MFIFQLKEKSAQTKSAKQNSLFASFEKPILKYYGKDAGTQRVQEFLSWLKKNDKELTAQFYDDIKSGRLDLSQLPENDSRTIAFISGAWLGGRYMAYKMGLNVKRYPHAMYDPSSTAFAMGYAGKIDIMVIGGEMLKTVLGGASATSALLAGINTGIHEYGHAAPYIAGKAGAGIYSSELGVSYVQGLIAMPIKKSDNIYNFVSVRNAHKDIMEAIGLLDEKRAGLLIQEYLTHAAMPWISKRLSKNFDLCSFSGVSYDRPEVHLLDVFEGKFNEKHFMEDCRLPDKKLMDELLGVIHTVIEKTKKINSTGMQKTMDFLELYSTEMTKKFGIPTQWDYPYDYSSIDGDGSILERYGFAGVVPSKNTTG